MGIKLKRMSKLLTQAELAKQLGVSRSAITMWETGKSTPNTPTLKKLAEILECSIDELLA